MSMIWLKGTTFFRICFVLLRVDLALGRSARSSFFAYRYLRWVRGWEPYFFVFRWATSRTSWSPVFKFLTASAEEFEFVSFLQFGAWFGHQILLFLDLWGLFFSGIRKFPSSLRCPGFTGCLLTRVDVCVLSPAQSHPVAAGGTLGTPRLREKMPSLSILSLGHFINYKVSQIWSNY